MDRIVLWSARIGSLISIGLLLLFTLAGGRSGLPGTGKEWAGFVFFPSGVALGMTLGWWREGLGGSLSVGSLLAWRLGRTPGINRPAEG